MNEKNDFLTAHLRSNVEKPPFTPLQVKTRYHLAVIRRQSQRRVRLVISGAALVGALLGFLFLNMNGEIGPGFFGPTRVGAATPFPTVTVKPILSTLSPVRTPVP